MNYKKLLFTLIISLFCFAGNSQFYTPAQLTTINTGKTAYEGDMYLDTVNKQYFIGLTTGELSRLGYLDSVTYNK